MAKYRQIHLSFWQDPFIEELEPLAKYFYLYLMTNSKTTQCGCFEISHKLIRYETGLTNKEIDTYIKLFENNNKINYNSDNMEFLILNWLKHNSFKSPKVLTCIRGELVNIKTQQYIQYINDILNGDMPIDRLSIDYPRSIDTGSQEEEEQEEEQEEEKNNKYKDIFDYYLTLNLIKHKSYTEEMTKSIKHAEKVLSIDTEHMKRMLKRHEEKVIKSKNSQYKTKPRELSVFFGQKKSNSTVLICSDYLDEYYEDEKQEPENMDWRTVTWISK
jgi:hypothetical protein